MHPHRPEAPAHHPVPPPPELHRPRGKPYVSYAVLALSLAMFVVDSAVFGGDHPLALLGPLVAEGDWWRLLSTVITHGGALHLVLNMSIVWTMGRVYEVAIGSWRFAQISLVSALGASAFVLIFSFDMPTVGASGMILGWVGAVLPIANQAHRRELMTWLVQVAIISLLPGVSWQGHLGGFVFGLACGLALKLRGEVFRYAAPVLAFIAAALSVVTVRGGF